MRYIIVYGSGDENYFIQTCKLISAYEHHQKINCDDYNFLKICIWEDSDNITLSIKKLEENNGKKIYSILENSKMDFLEYQEDKHIFYLHISSNEIELNGEKAFDVIPLRYFSLLRRRYENVILGIENNNIPNKQRISGYMYIDSLIGMNKWLSRKAIKDKGNKRRYAFSISQENLDKDKFYNQIYLLDTDVSRLSIHNMGSLNKIVPCIYLDWDWYGVLTDIVKNQFICFTKENQNIIEDIPVIDDYIYKLQMECIKQGKSTQEINGYKNCMSGQEWHKILYTTIIKDICLDNMRDSKLLDEDDSHNLYNECKEMSILSLLLFSSFVHFIYETSKEEISKVDINNLIQLSQDFADGLIQLIENALDYAEQACFSFRIHHGDSVCLKTNYKEFSTETGTYYLEVLVTDINYKADLVNTFLHNLEHRVSVGEMSKALSDKIKDNISLAGFFVPDESMRTLWEEYYAFAENATNHYGLQLFDSLVSSYKGFFRVVSGVKSKGEAFYVNYSHEGKLKKQEKKNNTQQMSGTQYAIILPIKHRSEQKRTGIHMKPDFSDISLKNEWENNSVYGIKLFSKIEQCNISNYREWKKTAIKKIADNVRKNYETKKIYVIDISNCNGIMQAELIAKAMITFVLKKQEETLRIALINANYDFIIQFTRFFSIFYNKNGICRAMKNTQIFLCDKELKTEVTFAGETLESACASNEYWANAKGEYNYCVEVLQIILGRRAVSNKKNSILKGIAPFELLLYQNGSTLFEKRVYDDLMSNIQQESFGCCLENVHMRVGSKMHITDHFFETFQLFNTSLYNTRFSYLIARKINREIKNKKTARNIVLVGYDVYSELLLIEIKKTLETVFKKKVRYTIFEQSEKPIFRLWEENMSNGQFVIIVPTNTTLTTHGKIIVELGKKTKKREKISENILLNIAVILIRDSAIKNRRENPEQLSDIEKKYWDEFVPSEHKITVKTASAKSVFYNVLVESEWQEPLKCQCCYPKDNFLDERPIIEVNRASVVPMIMAGPIESSLKTCEKINDYPVGNIRDLADVLIYGHIKRKNNHFEYYFKTDELIKNIINAGKKNDEHSFGKWVKYVKKQITDQRDKQKKEILQSYHQNVHIYDILVAPIHETNAAFIEIINDKVFNEVPIVIYIDSDKEYRDNILSKYSNLTVLYYNILSTGRRAIINFHYIDDSINSGTSFHRTHSLLRSLFPDDAYSKGSQIEINLFQNVILLLNRNSMDTIKDYVCGNNFYTYYSLKISSLRNHHEKACALCSRVDDYRRLDKYSAVSSMASYWKKLIVDNEIKDVREVISGHKVTDINYCRLSCIHEINSCLSAMGCARNDADAVKGLIRRIIIGKVKDNSIAVHERIKYVKTYFEVLSKPYLIYRKSILDIIFPITLEVMETIIDNNVKLDGADDSIGQCVMLLVNELPSETKNSIMRDFIAVLLNSLSEMNACYLIRKDVMNKVISYMKKIEFSENEWALLYGTAIKRVITLNKDENTSLWLEYLLLKKQEFQNKKGDDLKIDKDFEELLFYENITIISDAITELQQKGMRTEEDIEKIIPEYYFDNYRKLMNLDYADDLSEPISITQNEVWYEVRKVTKEMVGLQEHLIAQKQSDPKTFYPVLLKYIERITDAKYVSMYGIDSSSRIYIIAETELLYSKEDFLDIEEERKKRTSDKPDYLCDTVFYYDNKTILIRITGEKETSFGKKNESIDSVWLFLEFSEESKSLERSNSPEETDGSEGSKELGRQVSVSKQCKLAIRNILVHRCELLKRLQDDFKTDSFNRIKELSIQNELLSKSKAGSHTPDSDLQEIHNKLISIQKCDENVMSWAGILLQLASDSLISKLYVESIRDEANGKNEEKYLLLKSQFVFSSNVISLLEKMAFVNKNRSIDEPTLAVVKVQDDTKYIQYTHPQNYSFYMLFIIAAIVQNAVRHGKADGNGKVWVQISCSNQYLIINNLIKEGEGDDKKEKGITIIALKHFFRKYYGMNLDENVSEDKHYVVKLPLLYTAEGAKDE